MASVRAYLMYAMPFLVVVYITSSQHISQCLPLVLGYLGLVQWISLQIFIKSPIKLYRYATVIAVALLLCSQYIHINPRSMTGLITLQPTAKFSTKTTTTMTIKYMVETLGVSGKSVKSLIYPFSM